MITYEELRENGKLLVNDEYATQYFDEDGWTEHWVSSKVYAYNGRVYYVSLLNYNVAEVSCLSDEAEACNVK